MTEQRDWYLSMLGISQYRQRLPGEAVFNAGSSQVAAKVESGSHTVPGSESSTLATSGGIVKPSEIVSSLAGIRETLQGEPLVTPLEISNAGSSEALEHRLSENSQKNAQPNNFEQTVERENISFTLACWQVSDAVLVINGFEHGEGANRAELELLANILRAIGQLASSIPAAELIEWPLSPGAESSLAGAKTQLSMFLLGRQQVRPFRWLLAMGDEPARLLATEGGVNSLGQGTAETIFIPALQTILAEPQCKREVWQALRHLRDT